MFAPIVLFVYNRPWHTEQTIKLLSMNLSANESDLIIYSDAPKNNDDIENVNSVRHIIKNIIGFKYIKIIEREQNLGLANSIIDGVTNIVNTYGRVIVLEDDIITSRFFLTYMNNALDIYEYNENVISIHGYTFPVKKNLPDYFFLRGADCWGWATWKRGWDLFNPDSQFLLNEIEKQKLNKLFNFNNSYDYVGMLKLQKEGKISSWAIRWYASAFIANKFTLYPGNSYVNNIGLDGSGTNCGYTGNYNIEITKIFKPIPKLNVKDNLKARKEFTKYFLVQRKNSKLKLLYRVKRKMIYILNKFNQFL